MANSIEPTKAVLTRREAAEYLRIGKSTLDKLPIPKIQIRRRVLYRREAIDKWLAAQQTKQQAKGKGTPA